MMNHTYAQLFDYPNVCDVNIAHNTLQQTAYWYYPMFDTLVCYYYPATTSKLGPGVPSDATFLTSGVPCYIGTSQTNCSMWQQSYFDDEIYVAIVTTYANEILVH